MKLEKKQKQTWLFKMITANSGLSSKRFIALVALAMLAGVLIAQIAGVQMPDVVYYSLTSLVLGSSVFTLRYNSNNYGG